SMRPDAFYIFLFQAEDRIRDATVTGVQTCALPISSAGASADLHFVVESGRDDHGRREGGHAGTFGSNCPAYFLRSARPRRWSRLTHPGPEKKSQRKVSA